MSCEGGGSDGGVIWRDMCYSRLALYRCVMTWQYHNILMYYGVLSCL